MRIHFDLNENRDALLLKGQLADKVANNPQELEKSDIISGKALRE